MRSAACSIAYRSSPMARAGSRGLLLCSWTGLSRRCRRSRGTVISPHLPAFCSSRPSTPLKRLTQPFEAPPVSPTVRARSSTCALDQSSCRCSGSLMAVATRIGQLQHVRTRHLSGGAKTVWWWRGDLESLGAVCLGGGRHVRCRSGGGVGPCNRGRSDAERLGGEDREWALRASRADVGDRLPLSGLRRQLCDLPLQSGQPVARGHNRPRILSSLLLVGGVLFLTLHAVSDIGITGLLGAKLASFGSRHDPGVSYTLYLMTYALDSVGDVFGSLFALAAGLLVIRSAVLPRSLGRALILGAPFLSLSRLRPRWRDCLVWVGSRSRGIRAPSRLRSREQRDPAETRKRVPIP